MREIADKFVGGIERIDAEHPSARPGLTLRAVLIGLIGVIALSVFEPFNQNRYENTMLVGCHLPVGVVSFVMLLVLVVNPILIRLPESTSSVSRARLAVVWLCLLAAAVWLWRGGFGIVLRGAGEGYLSSRHAALLWLSWGGLLGVAFHVMRMRDRGGARAALPGRFTALSLVLTCVLPASLMTLAARDADPGILLLFIVVSLVALAVSQVLILLLRRCQPFAAGELVVVTSMMLIGCAVIWSGFHRLWAHQLVAPFYHLQTHPRWEPLVDVLPDWLVPAADPGNREIIYNFYGGRSDVPWGPWVVTALRWSPFLVAFFGGSLCLVAIFRRQWEEAEKISFPLAAITLETLRPPRPGRTLNNMLASRLFWVSLAIVILTQAMYGLHRYYPDFPSMQFKYDLHSALEMPVVRHLPHHIRAKDAFFLGVGVAFFLSTEMSFSLWGGVVLLGLVEMTGKSLQYPIQEHFEDHQVGAYIAYAVVIVWVARRHLWRVLRSIWEPGRAGDSPDALLPERWAAIGFLACFAMAVAWLTYAGLPWYVAALVALIVFILTLVIGRVVAESGLPFVQYVCAPHVFAESTIGPLLTARTHALIHFTTGAATIDARETLTPYAFNSARMADGVQRLNRRGLFGSWILALAVAWLVAGSTQLSIVYDRGAATTDEYAGRILPEKLYASSADFADLTDQGSGKVRAEHRRQIVDVGTGAGALLVLCLLRYRFLWWPLHPVGFVMAHTYPMQVFWLSIMIGWLFKWLVMRLGGVPIYRKLQPVFLGMIVGTAFSSVFWAVVKIASYGEGTQGQAVLFLPS